MSNPVKQLNGLYLDFMAGKMDRRAFTLRAGALGLSAASLSMVLKGVPAGAQDATPEASPIVTVEPQTSITYADYNAQIAEAFPFEEPANTGGTLILGDSTDISTMNILVAADSPTLDINGLVFETLVGSSPIDGQYVPALAEHWDIAEDGKTYTYHLHQNVMWHDGTPFTAADVIFSFDAQANESTGSSYTGSFNATVASYSMVDDYTVQMVATDLLASVVFFGNSYCPIVPKHIWESVDYANWAADPGSTGEDPARVVGTGPFKFQSWVQGDQTTLVKNENYWDPNFIPVVDEFIFKVWPDETAAIEALRAGEIDIFEQVPPADTQDIADAEETEVDIFDSLSFSFYAYNLDETKTTLFQDVRVRQALLRALDRQSMVDNIMLGLAEVAHGSQPTVSIAYAPDRITTKYEFDPEAAKAQLDEAGFVDAGDGVRANGDQKLAFDVMFPAGSATTEQLVAYIQEAWMAIGVEMTPNPVDFGTVLIPAITETFDYRIAMLGFSWDVTGDQTAMFSTDQYIQGFNMMKYSNPAVDELNKAAGTELDQAKRVEMLIEAADMVNEDLPVAVLFFRKDRQAYSARLHNYFPVAFGKYWSIAKVWIE